MRNKMGSEDFQKMMRHSREMLFDGLFHHPLTRSFLWIENKIILALKTSSV